MIVVDTNIIAYLWIRGEYSHICEKLFEIDSDWNAPLLWQSEFRNVLSGYLRRRNLSLDMALEIIRNAEQQMNGQEYTVSSEIVMSLVSRSDCSAYDCEFVALAINLNVPLITIDKKILDAFPQTAFTIQSYINSI